jgi:DNA-binding CsgD family transcriptional regulator
VADVDVIGRRSELAVLAELVGDQAALPRALLLEGEAGIGKTTLWLAGIRMATTAGFRVLMARPGEGERHLAYSGLGDVLGEVLDEALSDAPPPQRRALEVALLRRRAASAPNDRRAVSLGVLCGLRTMGAKSPLMIAIDDVQWLDASSVRALAFALKRAGPMRLALLTTLRRDPGAVDPLAVSISAWDVRRVHVGPLERAELTRVVRARSDRPPAASILERLDDAGGNPLFALELARAMQREAPAPGRPARVPSDLTEMLRRRLKALSPDTAQGLVLLSAMARPTEALLRDTIPSLDAAAVLSECEEAGIVVVDADRLRFTHPLLRSTAYWSAPLDRRRAVHSRLAESAPDLEERARHSALAADGPDRKRASLAQRAAVHARHRGAPVAAAELWELAEGLTPPKDAGRRFHRRREAALNRFDAGDVRGARAMLESLIASLEPGQRQAIAQIELAIRSYNDIMRVRELMLSALEHIGEHDVFLSFIHTNLAWTGCIRLELGDCERHARLALTLAERASDAVALRVSLGALAEARFLMGLDGEPLLERARSFDADIAPGEGIQPDSIGGAQLLRAGRIDEARVAILSADRRYIEAGLESMRHDTLPLLSELECLAGDWQAAQRFADEHADIVAQAGLDEMRDQVLYTSARIASLLGRTNDARLAATEGLAIAKAHGNVWLELHHRIVLGFLALSAEDHEGTVRVLEPCAEILGSRSVEEPGAFPFVPDLVEALVALGRLDQAKALTDRLQQQGLLLDRSLALATASRCRALIAAALGDAPGALLELELALQQHERVAIPFELARTQLVRGEVLRRMKRKREARLAMQEALSHFEVLGAPIWAERTRGGLARIGGRPPTPADLTETERRVATMVAAGRSNKEAAERLFISVKTVESNLRRIYQKLGVRSRTELASRYPVAAERFPDSASPGDQT